MSGAYRETAVDCPGCGTLLDQREVGEAIVDVCSACGGVWVDWFDGDLPEMVKGAADATPVGSFGGAGDSTCPRCSRPLEREGYLDSNLTVLRCSECAGAFVPRESAERLMGRKEPTVPMSHGPLGKLMAVLRELLGWDAS